MGIDGPRVLRSDFPDVLPEDDILQLLKACEGRGFIERRDAAIIRLFLDTGMRRAEIDGLGVADIDFGHNIAAALDKGRRPPACPFGRKRALAWTVMCARAPGIVRRTVQSCGSAAAGRRLTAGSIKSCGSALVRQASAT